MKRRLMAFLLAGALVASNVTPAFAADVAEDYDVVVYEDETAPDEEDAGAADDLAGDADEEIIDAVDDGAEDLGAPADDAGYEEDTSFDEPEDAAPVEEGEEEEEELPAADEGEAAAGARPLRGRFFQLFQAVLLQGDLVVVVHAVDAHHMHALVLLQKRLRQEGPDKPGRAGDQNGFVIQFHIHLSVYSRCTPSALRQTCALYFSLSSGQAARNAVSTFCRISSRFPGSAKAMTQPLKPAPA